VEEWRGKLDMGPDTAQSLLAVADHDGPEGVLEEVAGVRVFAYVAAAVVDVTDEDERRIDVAIVAAETRYDPAEAGNASGGGCCGLCYSKRQQ